MIVDHFHGICRSLSASGIGDIFHTKTLNKINADVVFAVLKEDKPFLERHKYITYYTYHNKDGDIIQTINA